jgi:hypothetical protein
VKVFDRRGNHPAGVTRAHPSGGDDAPVPDPVPRYEIRVRGRVSEAALTSFAGMDADVAPAETVLHGPVTDQARLHGLLDRIQSLGLELIEVRRLPPSDRPL